MTDKQTDRPIRFLQVKALTEQGAEGTAGAAGCGVATGAWVVWVYSVQEYGIEVTHTGVCTYVRTYVHTPVCVTSIPYSCTL